jgi:hypothetical protein
MVYVPTIVSVTVPWSAQMGASKMIAADASFNSHRAAQVVPTTTLALKNTRWPAAAVNVYWSVLPADSILPAPAAGCPFWTVSPMLIMNMSVVGTAVIWNE